MGACFSPPLPLSFFLFSSFPLPLTLRALEGLVLPSLLLPFSSPSSGIRDKGSGGQRFLLRFPLFSSPFFYP